jgi:hypothetical protein
MIRADFMPFGLPSLFIPLNQPLYSLVSFIILIAIGSLIIHLPVSSIGSAIISFIIHLSSQTFSRSTRGVRWPLRPPAACFWPSRVTFWPC